MSGFIAFILAIVSLFSSPRPVTTPPTSVPAVTTIVPVSRPSRTVPKPEAPQVTTSTTSTTQPETIFTCAALGCPGNPPAPEDS